MPKRIAKYVIQLTEDQRAALQALLKAGTTPARTQTHARILLKADTSPAGPTWSDGQIQAALEVSPATISRVRHTFVAQGLEAALHPKKPERVYARRLDGQQEAHLIALACSTPPDGRQRWTLRLLADKFVTLHHDAVDGSLSYETVRRLLKKTNSRRG